MANQIARLWLTRLGWFVVTVVGVVLLLHLKSAFLWVPEGDAVLTPEGWTGGTMRLEVHWEQYRTDLVRYVKEMATGDLRYTRNYGRPPMRVMDQLTASWKTSFALFAVGVTAGGLTGLLLGTLVALRRRLPDTLSVMTAVAGLSLPDFFLVLVGQAISVWTWIHWNAKPWLVLAEPNSLKGWLLPLIVISILPMGHMARLTASAMDEVMQEEYIRTARGKGLREVRVIYGHAFRNALPRIWSGLPTLFNLSLSSLPVVEQMTNWPGISKWLIFDGTFVGDQVGTWVGTGPGIVATAGIFFIAWFMVFDGLAHTVRIATAPRSAWREVA